MLMRRILLLLFCCSLFCLPSRADSEEDCLRIIRAGNGYLWRFMPKEAWDEYHKAMAMSQAMHNDYLFAESLFGVGQALWYNGQFGLAADTVGLSLRYYRRVGAKGGEGRALRILSNIYDDQGKYEEAFKTVTEGLAIYEGSQDNHTYVLLLAQMGALYKSMGDYQSALEYMRKAESLRPFKNEYPYREMYNRMGELYAAMGSIQQARRCYQLALAGTWKSKIVRLKMGHTYLLEKNYDIAFKYYDSLYQESSRVTDRNILIGSMLGLGRIYLQRNDLQNALAMAEGSLVHSAQWGNARQNTRDGYGLLSAIYEAAGNDRKALEYHKQYEAMKDSVVSDNFKRTLFGFRQEAEAGRLKAQRNTLIACTAGVVLLGLFVVLILHLRHKNEKLNLRQRAAELEMKALRAQMNPHFIFNCLSSINHFILNEESDKASEYLTRFSKLIRTVLVNAGKTTISLEEELAMLRLYLNMEQLRFREAFDYAVEFEPGLHPSMIFVPSFILQPFCENAIWHGLLHKEGKGRLNIHFRMHDDVLICTIRDNGIGREAAAGVKPGPVEKGASFGNRLSAERLALFNGNQQDASFVTEDVRDDRGAIAGTKVILRINNKQVHD